MDSKRENSLKRHPDMRPAASASIEFLKKEAELGGREGFERYLAAVPDVAPHENDRLEN